MKQKKLSQIDYATFEKAVTREWGGISTATCKRMILKYQDTIQDLIKKQFEYFFAQKLEGCFPTTFIPTEGPLSKITTMEYVSSENLVSIGSIYGYTDNNKKYELVRYMFDIEPVNDSYLEFGFVIKTRVRANHEDMREIGESYLGPVFGPFDLDYMFRCNKYFLSTSKIYINSSFDEEENAFFERAIEWTAISAIHSFIENLIDYNWYLSEMSKEAFNMNVNIVELHQRLTSLLSQPEDSEPNDTVQLAIEHSQLLVEYNKDTQAM